MSDDLRARLAGLTLRDAQRLGRRLGRGGRPDKDLLAQLDAAEQRVARRSANVPTIGYPAELPVSQAREELLAAIRDHQVVVVAGETGSGKTTQLPKLCLELGRGIRGQIGHTQPRRIAARTVAERIAEETGTALGSTVGWKVRFTDHSSDDTLVKVMTDGILLAEIQTDRDLLRYDTIILDEAHERSLNVDFLLGYLKALLPRRPDLKLVITSATIDPERFATHFDDAPIVEVSGRTYPVEVRYRPVVDPDDPRADADRDQVDAILDAVDELAAEGPGDVLVFLSGEREIRDSAEALRGRVGPNTEILPLYARLSAAEQHRVFQRHPSRRIVLATNVAETSLTVPGICYVVDPGTARISRYSHRTKVQRLPIEPISQASATQRAGRCGRTSDGICIRLYAEADFLARPEFTDPEILRTNLASVILQMTALGIGDVAAFPFVDPPDRRNVAAGVQLLEELGALAAQRLTPLGRQLAQLPVDPRIGRMILAAAEQGCVHEVLVIASALSIVDPRERPTEHQQAADAAHARFAEPNSDFLSWLRLWDHVTEQQRELSGNRFRRLCRTEFLHYLRVREWQDLYAQLRQVAKGLGVTVTSARDDAAAIHRAVIPGLLSHVGSREGPRDYLGARGARFLIWPGSALARKPPQWVVAAELVETSRLFARTVAAVDPLAVEAAAGHLVLRVYSEPRWDAKRGSVLATEKVTLYGVPLVTARTVQYGAVDPALSRELFIRHALVEGDWTTRHPFFAANRTTLARIAGLEDRARRRGIRIDDDALFELYDERIPAHVVSARHFDGWWKQARREQPDLLEFSAEQLTNAAAADAVSFGDFPDALDRGGLTLPLAYAFAPGAARDGVSVDVPLSTLEALPGDELSWVPPGLRPELVTALLRSLRKDVRRSFVPVAATVEAVLPELGDGPLLPSLADALVRRTGVAVPAEAWRPDRLPDHLRPTFRVIEDATPDGRRPRVLASGKDLAELRRRVAPRLAAAVSAATVDLERTGLTDWPAQSLPAEVRIAPGGRPVTVYPALVDEGTSVAVRALRSAAEARRATWAGTRRLLQLTVPSPLKAVVRQLPPRLKLGLQASPAGSVPELLDDCVRAALDVVLADAGGPPRDPAGFRALQADARARLIPLTTELVTAVEPVLAAAREVADLIAHARGLPEETDVDLRAQLAGLVHPGFVSGTGRDRLRDLPRYLRGMSHRIERIPAAVARDAVAMTRVHAVHDEYRQLAADRPDDPAVRDLRWQLEELRISLFAQTLGTRGPVSEKRIYRAMDAIAPPA